MSPKAFNCSAACCSPFTLVGSTDFVQETSTKLCKPQCSGAACQLACVTRCTCCHAECHRQTQPRVLLWLRATTVTGPHQDLTCK